MIMKKVAAILTVVGVAAVAGCSSGRPASSDAASSSSCTSSVPSNHYAGFSVAGYPPDRNNLTAIENASGIHATAVSAYISLGAKLDISAVTSICTHGALPLVEIDSDQLLLTSIADGSEDGALASYAKELAGLHSPVAVDFDHEFNGSWYDWGLGHQSPSNFIAAWRHVVTVFRQNGATNIIWVWNPAVSISGTSSDFKLWYPGDSYVTWVGLDGYFTGPQSTFATVFAPALQVVRGFTAHPVFIVETGANPASGRVRAINSLFAGLAATPNILGYIWFDYDTQAGHDWVINDDHAALAALRAGAQKYTRDG
jgi:mannan endo-1,4-beta-mannosidase